MILTVTLNPAVDKTLLIPEFTIDAVNRVQQVILDPGGKGINVSKSVQALGGDTMCFGVLGGETGTYILNALKDMGIKQDMVFVQTPTRTNTKIVDLVRGTNTDVNEAGSAVSEAALREVKQKLLSAAKPGDTVVIAGKNPPNTPDDLLAVWTRELKAAGLRVCLDTVGRPMQLAIFEGPFAIKPNREELAELVGRELETDQEVIGAAKDLLQNGIELVCVSLGGDGAIFVTADETVRTVCPKVCVVSTVGAGDSMMAALAYAVQCGCSLQQIAQRATATATATVQIRGSQPAPLELVKEMMASVRVEHI